MEILFYRKMTEKVDMTRVVGKGDIHLHMRAAEYYMDCPEVKCDHFSHS